MSAARAASARQEAEAADLAHCRAAIQAGSLSFHAASQLLSARVRDLALALYAFCRWPTTRWTGPPSPRQP